QVGQALAGGTVQHQQGRHGGDDTETSPQHDRASAVTSGAAPRRREAGRGDHRHTVATKRGAAKAPAATYAATCPDLNQTERCTAWATRRTAGRPPSARNVQPSLWESAALPRRRH